MKPAAQSTKRLVLGSSWKMNKTRAEAREFVLHLLQDLPAYDAARVQAFVMPPFTALDTVRRTLGAHPLEVGAQNVFWEDAGAYTGEVSPLMLRELGCTLVLLGHSDRRRMFGDDDERLNRKVLACLRHGLAPVLCVGETAEERDSGRTEEVLARQLGIALRGVPPEWMSQLMTLYEPRWAIGAQAAATPEYIAETHGLLRGLVERLYDAGTARAHRILYGGSVTLENLETILRLPEVDGCGIGRAAWDARTFAAMVRVAERVAWDKES